MPPDDPNQLSRELIQSLERELAQGCTDSTVAGGVAALAKRFETALAQTKAGAGEQRKLVEGVRGYSGLDLASRRKLAKRLIEVLGGQTPSKSSSSPSKLELQAPVSALRAVGSGGKRAALFASVGVKTLEDLLRYFPARYEDRRKVALLAELAPDERQATCVGVTGPGETLRLRGRSITRVPVADASGHGWLVWFNQPYRATQFEAGKRLYVFGKVRRRATGVELLAPECEPVRADDSLAVGRVTPIYRLTKGLPQWVVRKATWEALQRTLWAVEETLPPDLLERERLMPLRTALKQIHYPETFQLKEQARRRLAFEELLLLQLLVVQRKHKMRALASPVLKMDEAFRRKVKRLLPFELTRAQKRAVNEIARDMCTPHPMNRLLHGDVGSGKTLVAWCAMLLAAHNGYQSAVMAPTELLAEQHWRSLAPLLEKAGLKPALLTGSLPDAERKELLERLAKGELDVVIGTHALFQEKVIFHNLALVVVDEQHRFGVQQRQALRRKGESPHLLAMSATPIPRTLALTVYGDLEVSTLDERPPGRKPIQTKVFPASGRRQAYDFVRRQLAEGAQAYVVCPMIEESEALEAKSAIKLYEELRSTWLKGFTLGLVHGRMKQEERQATMQAFAAGEVQVLVATTVIEVGVDVPKATLMVVENAERFGLAQLHQLRGRVGRGEAQSYCILISDMRNEEARERLRVLEQTDNGFILAEKDLELRGPGEFLGTRQHGLPDLQVADLFQDVELLKHARRAAFELVEGDPALEAPEHRRLRRLLELQQAKLETLASTD